MAERKGTALWDAKIVTGAPIDSLRKFDPRIQSHNPVMFVVEVTALAVTVILGRDIFSGRTGLVVFELQIALWLWFTVAFANFAEAMAEGRGKAQADICARPAPRPRRDCSRRAASAWCRRPRCGAATSY